MKARSPGRGARRPDLNPGDLPWRPPRAWSCQLPWAAVFFRQPARHQARPSLHATPLCDAEAKSLVVARPTSGPADSTPNERISSKEELLLGFEWVEQESRAVPEPLLAPVNVGRASTVIRLLRAAPARPHAPLGRGFQLFATCVRRPARSPAALAPPSHPAGKAPESLAPSVPTPPDARACLALTYVPAPARRAAPYRRAPVR